MECLNKALSLDDELCPTTTPSYFAETTICEHLVIPPQKPPKELITNVIKKFVVSDIEVLKVDLGDRDPAKESIRVKVVVTGTVSLGIEYSALMDEQEVHYVHFDIPFQAIIGTRPCNPVNRGLIDDPTFDIDKFKLHVCLEHEQYHQLSPRDIKAVMVLLFWLEPK